MDIKQRTYSRTSKSAVLLLGNLIKLGRKQRRMTLKDLSERVGISRGTLQRIEKGDLKCEIGLVFEVAITVGIQLFQTDNLSVPIDRIGDKLALLPAHIRRAKTEVDDEF